MKMLLGYEVGTGEPVTVPVKHMAVTGATQEAGKTTTLEALIGRGAADGLRALAFVTKRGEGSFTEGRRIKPYFRDDAGGRPYWEFVESMASAAIAQQKMKFERAWIVKACRNATTLKAVRDNLRSLASSSKRSMDQDIYMLLGEYLDIVMPQISKLPRVESIDLQPGLNVMDLTAYTEELQMLIVRAALLWVHEREENCITIIPEAWKFVPEGRLTPVKPAAEKLIREGAGLRNFVWIDSQDIAGVWKLILRSAAVWIVGVQREANEIKRTLANIPASFKKPKARDIATLDRGQFFACYGKQIIKTYVRPAWMPDDEARAVAQGGHATTAPPPRRQAEQVAAPVTTAPKVEPETPNESEAVEVSNDATNQKLDRLIELMTLNAMPRVAPADIPVAPSPATAAAVSMPQDEDALYQRFKARLLKEAPALLKLLVTKPEMEIEFDKRVIELDGKSLRGRIAKLINSGFINNARTNSEIYKELKRTGPEANTANIGRELKTLVADGFLTAESDGFKRVEGMKITIK